MRGSVGWQISLMLRSGMAAARCALCSSAALWAVPSYGATLGSTLERAVALHVTQGGLDHIGDAIEAIVPTTIDIEGSDGWFECSAEDGPTLYYLTEPVELDLVADDVEIVASAGRLDATLRLTLSSADSMLYAVGSCGVLEGIWEACAFDVPTTSLEVHVGMLVAAVEGEFDVTVEPLTIEMSPIGNPLDDCMVASGVGTLLGQDPYAISNLILSYVEPELQGLGTTIETELETQLDAFAYETELPLGDTSISLALEPSLVELSDAGMVIGLGATIDATPSSCVDSSAGSQLLDSPWPNFGEVAEGTSFPYDAGLFVSKDFADQLLYAVWAGGLLCLEVDNLNGIELDAEFVGALIGPEFSSMFAPEAPATLRVVPDAAPTMAFYHDGPQLRIGLTNLGLELGSELDHHPVRAFRADIEAELGLDVALVDRTITPSVVLDESTLRFHEQYSELLSPGYSSALASMAGTVIEPFLPDDLLPSFTIPEFMGVGFELLVWQPTTDAAWQAAYIRIDDSQITPIEVSGCSMSSSGCGSVEGDEMDFESMLGCNDPEGSGCEESGCGTTGPAGRLAGILTVIAATWLRRRSARST